MSLFKEGYVDAGGPQAFGTIYLMLLEDQGTNTLQLQQAGLVEYDHGNFGSIERIAESICNYL